MTDRDDFEAAWREYSGQATNETAACLVARHFFQAGRRASDLHAAIMNLPYPWVGKPGVMRRSLDYREGHRDALHAAAELVAAHPSVVDGGRQAEPLSEDAITLAFRLYGEDPDTFAPETREVMDRLRPIVAARLRGEA